jgi:hypothetical protein
MQGVFWKTTSDATNARITELVQCLRLGACSPWYRFGALPIHKANSAGGEMKGLADNPILSLKPSVSPSGRYAEKSWLDIFFRWSTPEDTSQPIPKNFCEVRKRANDFHPSIKASCKRIAREMWITKS